MNKVCELKKDINECDAVHNPKHYKLKGLDIESVDVIRATLTEEEFKAMQAHTWLGSKLFLSGNTLVDAMSRDIALRHHENWDGSGYPGFINKETGEAEKMDYSTGKNQGLKGEEIPLSARIVSIADVYDALSSRRTYKEAWEEDEVLNEIKKSSGTKFDPALVDCFFEALPNIQAIKNLFAE